MSRINKSSDILLLDLHYHIKLMTLLPMVHPIVPSRRSKSFARKSIKFLDALCVSRMRPNSESYDGGSAVKQ